MHTFTTLCKLCGLTFTCWSFKFLCSALFEEIKINSTENVCCSFYNAMLIWKVLFILNNPCFVGFLIVTIILELTWEWYVNFTFKSVMTLKNQRNKLTNKYISAINEKKYQRIKKVYDTTQEILTDVI